MKKNLKKTLSLLLRVFLSLGFLIYLYFQIDIDKTKTILKSANLLYVFYTFLIYVFITVVILIARWWILVRALGLRVPWVSIVRYHFIGLFGNIILPTAIGGDVVKILGLCTHSAEKPKVVGSVVLDRLSGFAGMIVVATAAFIIGYTLIPDFSLGFSILILTVISIMATIVLFNERLYTFCCRIFTPFPKIRKELMRMHYDIKLIMGRKGALVLAVILSCLAQVILAFGFYLLAQALHQDIAFVYFLVFVPLISVTSSLPSIGGLGVREAGVVFLFAKVGMSQGVALSISLMGYVFSVLIGIAGGLIFMMTDQLNLKQWKAAAATLEENGE